MQKTLATAIRMAIRRSRIANEGHVVVPASDRPGFIISKARRYLGVNAVYNTDEPLKYSYPK